MKMMIEMNDLRNKEVHEFLANQLVSNDEYDYISVEVPMRGDFAMHDLIGALNLVEKIRDEIQKNKLNLWIYMASFTRYELTGKSFYVLNFIKEKRSEQVST